MAYVLLFLLIPLAIFGTLSYLHWRAEGCPEETYGRWLLSGFSAFAQRITLELREKRAAASVTPTRDLPEVPLPGAHRDTLDLPEDERQREIDALEKLFEDSH